MPIGSTERVHALCLAGLAIGQRSAPVGLDHEDFELVVQQRLIVSSEVLIGWRLYQLVLAPICQQRMTLRAVWLLKPKVLNPALQFLNRRRKARIAQDGLRLPIVEDGSNSNACQSVRQARVVAGRA